MSLCNGVLCGLVSVTPGCGVIDVWAGILVAILGSATFLVIDALMLRWVARTPARARARPSACKRQVHSAPRGPRARRLPFRRA